MQIKQREGKKESPDVHPARPTTPQEGQRGQEEDQSKEGNQKAEKI